MARVKELKSENDVKDSIKQWLDRRNAWSYAPIQNGMGVIGIHDRIACLPVTVTEAMVGKRIGLFLSIEAKAPGRRGEDDRGLSKHQRRHMNAIHMAKGISLVCDGLEDLGELEQLLDRLQWGGE